MKIGSATLGRHCVPKRSRRHYSYDESLDEPVEVEHETPAEENESIEGTEENNSEPPVIEE
jgi:hypothetical protein